MIQLIHVSKQYDQRPALSDVTLEIGKGEFVLLMGPSGAGKSTLLRMLIGAERPDEGQIFVHQKNVTTLKPSDVPYLRRKVGTKWERVSIEAAPRSIYLMRGPSRTEWEHSIPPVGALRYSVTFRNFRDAS